MNQEKKLEKVLDRALSEDLDEYLKLLKVLKKRLPLFGRTKRITAALLKELLGDVSKLDIESFKHAGKTETGKIIFEDIKDGRARLFINIGKSRFAENYHKLFRVLTSRISGEKLVHCV